MINTAVSKKTQTNKRMSDLRGAVEKTLSTLTWVFEVGAWLFNSIKNIQNEVSDTVLSFRLHSRSHHFYTGTVLRESSCSEWHRLKGWSPHFSVQATEKDVPRSGMNLDESRQSEAAGRTPPCLLVCAVTLRLSAAAGSCFPRVERTLLWSSRGLMATTCFLVPPQDQLPPSSHFVLVYADDAPLTHR